MRVVFAPLSLSALLLSMRAHAADAAPAPVPAAASAPETTSAPAAEEQGTAPPTRWYGWQTLLCDVAALPQIGLAFAKDLSPLYVTGGLTYVGCAPIIHLVHDQFFIGSVSMGGRILAPAALAGIGYGVGSLFPTRTGDGPTPGTTAAAIGGGIGLVGIMVLDSVVLARQVVPLWERESAKLRLRPMGLGAQLSASF